MFHDALELPGERRQLVFRQAETTAAPDPRSALGRAQRAAEGDLATCVTAGPVTGFPCQGGERGSAGDFQRHGGTIVDHPPRGTAARVSITDPMVYTVCSRLPWAEEAAMYSVTNPATGELVEEIPNATDEEVRAAIERVHRGFAAWRARPVAERAAIVVRAAELFAERADELAADHDPGDGEADQRRPRRGRRRRRHLPLLRRARPGPAGRRAARSSAAARPC